MFLSLATLLLDYDHDVNEDVADSDQNEAHVEAGPFHNRCHVQLQTCAHKDVPESTKKSLKSKITFLPDLITVAHAQNIKLELPTISIQLVIRKHSFQQWIMKMTLLTFSVQ